MTESGRNVAAVIEFSSNNIRMIVGERSGDGVRSLDFMEYPLSIGKDTFTLGKVEIDKVNTACLVVKNYIHAAAAYGVMPRDVRIVATSALREASNKNYILDQVRLKTGIVIRILDSQEEKFQIFKSALRLMAQRRDGLEGPSLLVFLGSGNVGFSVIERGRITFYQSILIGPLRVSELFDDVARRSSEYHVVVGEYVRTFLSQKTMLLPDKINDLIFTGGDVNIIRALCGDATHIKKPDFDRLYDRIKNASTEIIARELHIPHYRADILIPALSILGNFFGLSAQQTAFAPPAYLNESMLYRVLFPKQSAASDKDFYKNTVLCVEGIARHYGVSEAHAAQVDNFSILIFDKIRKLHGMGPRERTLLRCAAHLHDCGKFIGIRQHALNSHNIVQGLDIIGFNQQDMRILATICLLHSGQDPDKFPSFVNMPDAEKTVTAKLSAILRLADALDRGASQKIKSIDVSRDDDNLTILANTSANIDLEKWSFTQKHAFFAEVFGINAVLKVKNTFV